MINRHIRHDWQTFVDWEQKSVRSVCGVTTKRHLAGIPGITVQEPITVIGGRQRYGWCVRCCVIAGRTAAKALSARDIQGLYLAPPINGLYVSVLTEVNVVLAAWASYRNNLPPA